MSKGLLSPLYHATKQLLIPLNKLRYFGTSRCDREKNKLKILDFEINEEDETFILHLDKNFDYYSVYQFDLDLDRFFKSELTLEFNVIKK